MQVNFGKLFGRPDLPKCICYTIMQESRGERMYQKVQALVLRVTDFNDTDAILSLLTASQGKLTAKVRGLRRKNSPMIAPCQLLAYSEFVLFEHKGFYTVNEARTIELFQNLRKDLVKLSLGTYFAQAAEVVSQVDYPDTSLLSLTLNSMYALANLNHSADKIKAVFELRCACFAGYAPDLYGCSVCGTPNADRFDIAEGRLECHGCRTTESIGIRLPITPGILDAMRYIISADSKHMFSFEISDDSMATLSAITESYLSSRLERSFSALDFYKTIQ